MSGFDHHNPEIEQMMWERARAQGDTLVAENPAVARHHERREAQMRDWAQLMAVEMQALTDAFNKVMQTAGSAFDKFAEAMKHNNLQGLKSDHAWFDEPVWAQPVGPVGIDEPRLRRQRHAALGDRLKHGASAVCPKHGPTKGGLCRRCSRGGR